MPNPDSGREAVLKIGLSDKSLDDANLLFHEVCQRVVGLFNSRLGHVSVAALGILLARRCHQEREANGELPMAELAGRQPAV